MIIASTLTRRGADISMKALAAGAADYLTKPGASALTSADEFKRELLAKVKALGQARRRAAGAAAPQMLARAPVRSRRRRPSRSAASWRCARGARAGRGARHRLVDRRAAGALPLCMGALKGALKLPIFITQHMPATFTTILAEHVGRASGYVSPRASTASPCAAAASMSRRAIST